MERLFCLIVGIIILTVSLYDFFYTTLSGSGAGYLSKTCASITHKLVLFSERNLSKKFFKVSGLVVNLAVLTMWVILVWLGLFLVYSFNPEDITNSSGKEASAMERLYFTGYVLSTLGIGNFKPVSPSFEILTSMFSFFGFAFFSTSMTYLLSVSSAVVQKRSLASSIRSLGSSPAEIVKRFIAIDRSFGYQQISKLQQMVNQYSTYYQAYPILHFYHSYDDALSMSINISALDEAVSIMLNSPAFSDIHEELQLLRDSLNQLFKHLKSRFGLKASQTPNIDWHQLNFPDDLLKEDFSKDPTLPERRKVLTSFLSTENKSWKDVYPTPAWQASR